MKRTLVKFRNSTFLKFIGKYEKYIPVIFFIGGFIFDTITLGRVDRLYDIVVLWLHMSCLSITLYLFNLVDDNRWQNTWLERYQAYFPLAIQFFFGGLTSAYVIYFSRSVSLSKTATFFIILLALLLANEFLKKRISNKYLQFSVYFFLSLTFFTFMIPVIFNVMSTKTFIVSGIVSFTITMLLIAFIYKSSPSTRKEIHLAKLIGIIVGIYALINTFYFFNLIPPVPLALENGIAAHRITIKNDRYFLTYERDDPFMFWREHRTKFIYTPNQKVYVFSSIFAPTDLKKMIIHKWRWYDEEQAEWEVMDSISYQITGGRNQGFRGYTYKSNIKEGLWKVDVLTEEELLIGVIDFEIVVNPNLNPKRMIEKSF